MTFFLRKAEESYFKKETCSQNEHQTLALFPGSYLSLRKTSWRGPWEQVFVRCNMGRVRQLTSDLQTET